MEEFTIFALKVVLSALLKGIHPAHIKIELTRAQNGRKRPQSAFNTSESSSDGSWEVQSGAGTSESSISAKMAEFTIFALKVVFLVHLEGIQPLSKLR